MSWIDDLIGLIKRVVGIELPKVHTHLPAQVVSYNGTTNTCSCRVCIKAIRPEDPDNDSVEYAVLDDVPVRQFGSGKLLLSVAPQVDSYGLLHISERSLEVWMQNGGIDVPNSTRRFDISDAVFEPGLYPLKTDGDNGLIAVPINTDRIELRTRAGTSYVAVLDDGTVTLMSSSAGYISLETNGTITAENSSGIIELQSSGNVICDGPLVKLIDGSTEPAMQGNKFMTKYNAHTHSTAFGPSGPPIVPWTAGDMSSKVTVG